MLNSPTRRAIALAILLALPGCSAITESESDFARARAQWASERPSAYDYTMRRSCFCLDDVTRAVVVVVQGTTVVSRTYADNGATVPAAFNSAFPTIDGVFDIIGGAIDRNSVRVDVTYDPALGYPTTIALDGATNIADDESWYTLTNFHVR